MKESIKIIVVDDRNDQGSEKELEIIYEEDTLALVLDGQPVFGGDWIANFKPAFERALMLWPD